jgi:hypothetical protein
MAVKRRPAFSRIPSPTLSPTMMTTIRRLLLHPHLRRLLSSSKRISLNLKTGCTSPGSTFPSLKQSIHHLPRARESPRLLNGRKKYSSTRSSSSQSFLRKAVHRRNPNPQPLPPRSEPPEEEEGNEASKQNNLNKTPPLHLLRPQPSTSPTLPRSLPAPTPIPKTQPPKHRATPQTARRRTLTIRRTSTTLILRFRASNIFRLLKGC